MINTAQFLNIIVPLIVSATAAWINKTGISTDQWSDCLMKVGAILASIITWGVAHYFHGIPMRDPQAPTNSSNTVKKAVSTLLLLGALAAVSTGCTSVYTNGCVTTVQQRFFGLNITSTSASTQTPSIQLGAGSSIVQIEPTSTNMLYAAPFFSTAQANASWNPFDVGLSETIGEGNVAALIGTNGTSQATTIVPKAVKPNK